MDVVSAQARGEAKEWCVRSKVFESARRDIDLYYVNNCNGLARAWCHRMHYVHKLGTTGVW